MAEVGHQKDRTHESALGIVFKSSDNFSHNGNYLGRSRWGASGRGNSQNKNKFPFKCQNCGRYGHKRAESISIQRQQAYSAEEDSEITFFTAEQVSGNSYYSNNEKITLMRDSVANHNLISEDVSKFLINGRKIESNVA